MSERISPEILKHINNIKHELVGKIKQNHSRINRVNNSVNRTKKRVQKNQNNIQINGGDIAVLKVTTNKNKIRLDRRAMDVAENQQKKAILQFNEFCKQRNIVINDTNNGVIYSNLFFIQNLYYERYESIFINDYPLILNNIFIALHNIGIIKITELERTNNPKLLSLGFKLNPQLLAITHKNIDKKIITKILFTNDLCTKWNGLNMLNYIRKNKNILVKKNEINSFNDSAFSNKRFAFAFRINTGYKNISFMTCLNKLSDQTLRELEQDENRKYTDCIIELDVNLLNYRIKGKDNRLVQVKKTEIRGQPLDPTWFLSPSKKIEIERARNRDQRRRESVVEIEETVVPSPPPPVILIPETVSVATTTQSENVLIRPPMPLLPPIARMPAIPPRPSGAPRVNPPPVIPRGYEPVRGQPRRVERVNPISSSSDPHIHQSRDQNIIPHDGNDGMLLPLEPELLAQPPIPIEDHARRRPPFGTRANARMNPINPLFVIPPRLRNPPR